MRRQMQPALDMHKSRSIASGLVGNSESCSVGWNASLRHTALQQVIAYIVHAAITAIDGDVIGKMLCAFAMPIEASPA